MPQQPERFGEAVLRRWMEEIETPSELRPIIVTVVANLRRLGLGDLEGAASEIFDRVDNGTLRDPSQLQRLADLLAIAHVGDAGSYLIDAEMTLDALDDQIHAGIFRRVASVLLAEARLRRSARVPFGAEERSIATGLRVALDEMLADPDLVEAAHAPASLTGFQTP